MAYPTPLNTPKEDHVVSATELHQLLASHANNNEDVASERLIRLNSLYGEDAPRDHFTPTSASLKTPSATDAHRLKRKARSTKSSPIESTDSEKAVKGSDSESQNGSRVMFQEAAVKELASHIPNDSSDEFYQRGEEVRIFQSDYSFSSVSKLE